MNATPVTQCGYPITQSPSECPGETTRSAETNRGEAGSATAGLAPHASDVTKGFARSMPGADNAALLGAY
jgi:hypothetical protein